MKIAKIKDVKTPSRGTPKSAGVDFYVPNDFITTTLFPGESIKIPSGIKVSIPEDYVMIAFNKSGIALSGLSVGACVIDEDYQGEIHIHLINHTNHKVEITPGKKITQFILLPVLYNNIEIVDEKDLFDKKTYRGDGGFGSTG